ncbi:MAG TPA: ribosome-associated translation inhibitor RaiA [Gemmataceae bacterium]
MQVKVSARHGHLDEATQKQIQEKAGRLLHYFNRITLIEVTVDLQKDEKSVEILVSAEHKHDFVAQDRHAEVLPAVEKALTKMEYQIHRYKEKIQDHRRDASAGEGAPGFAT